MTTTLTQLEYIVAVDQVRHFGKAAKACHVSQPSLSMQIQKFESDFGVTLFDRNKKPILPTEKGRRLIDQARAVLRENEKLLGMAAEESKHVSGDFRLGVIPTLAPYLVPLFIGRFSERYPKVRLSIDEMKTDLIVEALRNDQVDAGILATPLKESGLKERVLFYEPFYLYLNSSHKLVKKKKVSESHLDASEIWLLEDGHCLRNQVIHFCSIDQGTGVSGNVSFEGGNLETLRYIIQRNRGYTLFPELFVRNLSEQERVQRVRPFVDPEPSREVSLIHRRDQWKSDILDALEEVIKASLPPDSNRSSSKNRIDVV